MQKKWIAYLTNVNALQLFQLLRQSGVILTAILLAKSRLGVSEIGVYEMLLFVGYTLSFFWVSGLVQGLLTTFPKQKEGAKKVLIFNAFLVFCILSATVFLLLWWGQRVVLPLLTGRPELPYFKAFLFFLLFNLPCHLLEHFYLLLHRPGRILAFGLFSALGQLTAVVLPVFMGWGLYYSVLGMVIIGALKFSWLLHFVWRQGRWEFRAKMIRPWLVLSFPLVLYTLSAGFNHTFDSWLVNFAFAGDPTRFAVFRYGARELPFVMALANALSTALLPEVAADLSRGLQQLKVQSRRLFHFLFPTSIVLLLTSHWWFPLVFSEAFEESILIFNIFLLIIISRLIFSRTVLVGLNDNRVILGISLLELLANVLFSFLLLPALGLAGIALGTVLAHFVEKVLICLHLYRRFGIGVGAYTDLRWYLAYSLCLAAGFLWTIS